MHKELDMAAKEIDDNNISKFDMNDTIEQSLKDI
jgi:hypothetical protein